MNKVVFRVVLVVSISAIWGCGERKSAQSAVPAPVEASAQGSKVSDTAAPSGPAAPANANTSSDAKALASCAAEANVVKRLACFDAFTKTSGLAPETVNTSPAAAGKWLTSTDTDPLNDKQVHYATLIADEGRGRFGDRVTMTVRCKNMQTELYINWYTYLGSDGLQVISRVDKNPAATAYWSVSTDSKASFMPQPVSTLKKFDGAASFVVNLTPYNESPVTAIFDISGSSEAFKDIRRGCNW